MTVPDPLPIIFEDDSFVAVNKPASMLVHRTRMDARETLFVLQTLRNQVGHHVYPIHRLDKPTSGVLVFGKTAESAAALAESFRDREVSKYYLAVVRGYTDERGVIDCPLRKPDLPPGAVRDSAVTDFTRLARAELPCFVNRYASSRYSLVEVRPWTGRTHQIRRHLRHISHPIIGDRKYGDGKHNQFFGNHFGCRRLLLAATELRFEHPFTEDLVRIIATLDCSFLSVLERLEWRVSVPDEWLPA